MEQLSVTCLEDSQTILEFEENCPHKPEMLRQECLVSISDGYSAYPEVMCATINKEAAVEIIVYLEEFFSLKEG